MTEQTVTEQQYQQALEQMSRGESAWLNGVEVLRRADGWETLDAVGFFTSDASDVAAMLASFGDDVDAACEGHPAGPFDPMGETVYCDGTCKS